MAADSTSARRLPWGRFRRIQDAALAALLILAGCSSSSEPQLEASGFFFQNESSCAWTLNDEIFVSDDTEACAEPQPTADSFASASVPRWNEPGAGVVMVLLENREVVIVVDGAPEGAVATAAGVEIPKSTITSLYAVAVERSVLDATCQGASCLVPVTLIVGDDPPLEATLEYPSMVPEFFGVSIFERFES